MTDLVNIPPPPAKIGATVSHPTGSNRGKITFVSAFGTDVMVKWDRGAAQTHAASNLFYWDGPRRIWPPKLER